MLPGAATSHQVRLSWSRYDVGSRVGFRVKLQGSSLV